MTTPTRSQIAAMQALPAAIKRENNAAQPLNGIAANWFHDEGAIAQCSHCSRYTLDRKALHERDDRRTVCTCGSVHGWSGSFVKPGPDASWHGPSPALVGAENPATGD